jgi:hypothetical protein
LVESLNLERVAIGYRGVTAQNMNENGQEPRILAEILHFEIFKTYA